MSLFAKIGTVMRALPTAEGTQIKFQHEDGAIVLDVPLNRPELVSMATEARMTGSEMLVRHTEEGMVVALQHNTNQAAA